MSCLTDQSHANNNVRGRVVVEGTQNHRRRNTTTTTTTTKTTATTKNQTNQPSTMAKRKILSRTMQRWAVWVISTHNQCPAKTVAFAPHGIAPKKISKNKTNNHMIIDDDSFKRLCNKNKTHNIHMPRDYHLMESMPEFNNHQKSSFFFNEILFLFSFMFDSKMKR
jgi:hypothetical protein